MRRWIRAQRVLWCSLLAFVLAGAASAWAQDSLRVAVAQRGGWSTSVTELGIKQGFFAKRGVKIDLLYTDASGEAIQSIISGSIDVSVALGTGQVMGAFSRGAPLRIIGGAFTGANDILWYVPAKSPIKKLTDVKGNSFGYGATGSSTHLAALSAIEQYKLDAKLIRTGGYAATLTQVMSGQCDVGWLAPPVGLKEEEAGQIRIIGSGGDLAKFKNMTVRIIAANVHALETKKDQIARYMQGYRDTLDWLYSGTDGVKLFSEVMKVPQKLALRTRDGYFPKERMSPDRVTDLQGAMADAIKFKLLPRPLSAGELKTLVQIPAPIK